MVHERGGRAPSMAKWAFLPVNLDGRRFNRFVTDFPNGYLASADPEELRDGLGFEGEGVVLEIAPALPAVVARALVVGGAVVACVHALAESRAAVPVAPRLAVGTERIRLGVRDVQSEVLVEPHGNELRAAPLPIVEHGAR